ncbi:tyrosine-type recombinase/integrase [Blastopirellula marina]|uniref:Tyr recombinase domain-containing protein n=1 Tax=Blastopirellula marina TaxID=124 RepID=A0A2S8GIE5_9BACT|nr:tyrosine-type recombinase/integrase [Blastopirellula marina]PQO44218.1 hypothetical protein C5Y93_19795 [Blastopirellula marina]
MEDIKVLITQRDGRKFWQAYYVDPISGKQKFRSTKATSKRDAERFAGKWEAELRSGKFKAASKITWEEFTDRFILSHCSGLAEKTRYAYESAFSAIKRNIGPNMLRDVTAETLAKFQTKMREEGLAEASIACHLRHIKSALRWAADMELIPEPPKIKMPKRVKGASIAKGRAVTGEEFDRMIAKIPDVMFPKPKQEDGAEEPSESPLTPEQAETRNQVVGSWERFLRGLWLSGLRLNEAIDLNWGGGKGIVVLLDLPKPMLMIPAEAEKGNRDRLLPITPDFAEFLRAIPENQRRGKVFKLLRRDGHRLICRLTIGNRVAAIGKAAGIKVKDDGGKVKYASAHDLRRSFGTRWSRVLMPAALKVLMRHSSIQTTMAFYVAQDAESIADTIWEAARMNDSMNTSPKKAKNAEENDVSI